MEAKALLVKHVWLYDFRFLIREVRKANATWLGDLTGETFILESLNYSFIYWEYLLAAPWIQPEIIISEVRILKVT